MQWSALTFPEEDTSMRDYHSHHASLNPQSQSVSLIISPVISGLHVDITSWPFTKYMTFNIITFFLHLPENSNGRPAVPNGLVQSTQLGLDYCNWFYCISLLLYFMHTIARPTYTCKSESTNPCGWDYPPAVRGEKGGIAKTQTHFVSISVIRDVYYYKN